MTHFWLHFLRQKRCFDISRALVGDGLWTSRCIAQDRVVEDADPYEMVFVMSKFKVVYPL